VRPARIAASPAGKASGMSQSDDTPTELRHDVEEELEELEEEAAKEERERMAERDATGIDEPS